MENVLVISAKWTYGSGYCKLDLIYEFIFATFRVCLYISEVKKLAAKFE